MCLVRRLRLGPLSDDQTHPTSFNREGETTVTVTAVQANRAKYLSGKRREMQGILYTQDMNSLVLMITVIATLLQKFSNLSLYGHQLVSVFGTTDWSLIQQLVIRSCPLFPYRTKGLLSQQKLSRLSILNLIIKVFYIIT